jgi:AraC-like DNA-binding protein
MTSNLPTVCYRIASDAEFSCTSAGIRAPREPFHQARRILSDFVAFLVTDGEIHLADEMTDGTEQCTVRSGEIHIVAPGIWQSSLVPFAPGIRFLWLHFAIQGSYDRLNLRETDALARTLFTAPDESKSWLLPRHISLGDDLTWFVNLHSKILENMRLHSSNNRGVQLLAGTFLHELHRNYALSFLERDAPTQISPARAHVQRACVFIRLNAHRAISTRHVASAVGLNSAYLQRCFVREMGKTLGEFILEHKVQAARHLLKDSTLSIKEVAYQCGFASSTYFGRIFARMEGRSATEFREHLREVKSSD